MINEPFFLRELDTLRHELNNLKRCQFDAVKISIGATGVLLGLAVNAASNASLPYLGAYYLIPLTVLLPFWWIFFDKATSITRIVGYHRIVENVVLHRGVLAKAPGWENALALFRTRQQAGELRYQPESDAEDQAVSKQRKRLRQFIALTLLGTTKRYWILVYYIYFATSVLCIVLSLRTTTGFELSAGLLVMSASLLGAIAMIWKTRALIKMLLAMDSMAVLILGFSFIVPTPNDISAFLIGFSLYVTCISAIWNINMAWQLTWGDYSYEANWQSWKRLLGYSEIAGGEEETAYKTSRWLSKAKLNGLESIARHLN